VAGGSAVQETPEAFGSRGSAKLQAILHTIDRFVRLTASFNVSDGTVTLAAWNLPFRNPLFVNAIFEETDETCHQFRTDNSH